MHPSSPLSKKKKEKKKKILCIIATNKLNKKRIIKNLAFSERAHLHGQNYI